MSGLIVEGGIYFLLFFTPLAFGGVEMWAMGVLQIVSAIVFVAWAAGEGNPLTRPARPASHELPKNHPHHGDRPFWVFWTCIGSFVLLVLFQLVPLPGGLLRILSPATHRLYERTLPGYADGKEFRSADLPSWLVADQAARIPSVEGADGGPTPPELNLDGTAYPVTAPAWRSVSIYPFLTRERLTILLCLVGLFAAAAGHFRTRERLERLMGVAVGSVTVVSLLGIVQKLTWNGKLYWIREGEYGNIFGPFVNRNTYAGLAATVLPLAICMAFRALARYRDGDRNALPGVFLSSFSAVILCGGIFYSLSRGGMVAAAVGAAVVSVFLLYYGRHGFELAFLAALFVLAGIFILWIGSEEVVARVETISEGPGAPSMEMRITAWRETIRMIGDNWLLGTGLGNFGYAFMRYAPPGRTWWNIATNEFIGVFADTGILGGLFALTGLGAFALMVMKPSHFHERSGRYAFAGMVAGIVALLFHSNITSDLQMPADALLVVILGAALLNQVRRHPASRPRAGAEPVLVRRRRRRRS